MARRVSLWALAVGVAAAIVFGITLSSRPINQDATDRLGASPDPAEESSALELVTAAVATPDETYGGAGFFVHLARRGWEVEDFIQRAEVDPTFASRLGSMLGLCGLIDATTSARARFADSRWLAYREGCSLLPHRQISLDGRIFEFLRNQSAESEQLGVLIEKHPEGSPELSKAAAELLTSSSDFDTLALGAMAYFDADRMRTALAERPNRFIPSQGGELVQLQIDASLLVRCQFAAAGCGWDHPLVLLECAATAGCFPGMSMGQVIALRRSPQEVELLRALVAQVAELRRGA